MLSFAPLLPFHTNSARKKASKRIRRQPTFSQTPAPPTAPISERASTQASTDVVKDKAGEKRDTRCGFATLVGPSNSGKSTLLNHVLGQKLAIVTPKLQTTRCKIKGIATFEDVQTIFLDTPGIFEGDTRLSRAMVKSAWAAMRDADVTGVVLDVAEMYHVAKRSQREGLWVAGARDVMEKVGGRCEGGGVCVLANKMDCVEEEERGYVMERLRSYMGRCGMGEETRLFGISAVTGEGVEGFVDWVKEGMPRGVWLYAEDDVTDMPMRQIAEEVTRECAFMAVREELPYEIAVETRSYKVLKDGSVRIEQDLLVVRESQKRIVTGRGGQVVKTIGEKARKELKRAWGGEVHLMLTVRVRPGWKEERGMYERWGLDYNA